MKILKKTWPFLFLAAVTIAIFYKIIFLGHIFYAWDDAHVVAPQKFFIADQLLHGQIPLWDPYVFTGIPFFADINIGVLSLPTLLYFFLPAAKSLAFLIVLTVFLLGSFQYLLLRYLKISKLGSLIGGTVFAFAGTPFAYITGYSYLAVIVYIPILFYFANKLTEKKQMKYFFLLVLFQAIQLLSGHPRPTYYTVIFMSLFILFSKAFSMQKKIIILVCYFFFTLAISAIQLVPFAEFALLGNRPLASIDFASSGSLTPPYIIPFLFPTFFGTHLENTWWGPQLMIVGYLGIPAITFLFIGLWKGKIKDKLFYALSFLLAPFLAIGKISPLFILFYFVVPGWKSFRSPIDIMVFFTFFGTIFVGIGFDYYVRNIQKIRQVAKSILPYSLVVFFPFLAFFLISSRGYFWQNILNTLFHTYHLPVGRLLMYDPTKLQVMFVSMVGNVVLFLLFCAITLIFFVASQKYAKAIRFLFLIFIAVVFVYFDSKILLTTPYAFTQSNLPVPKILSDAQRGEYRILSLPVDLHQHREHLATVDFFYKESLANLNIYFGDNNIERHIYQVQGSSTLVPSSYATFIAGKNASAHVTDIDYTHMTQEQLSLSSIKYVLSHEKLASFSANLSLIEYSKGKYYIYENGKAYKRAYLENDPLGSAVKIVQSNPTKLRVDVGTLSPTHLILSDLYYPGWIALVNGRQVPIIPYQRTFRQIAIPKGNSTIIFVYEPASVMIGCIISAVTTIVFFISWFLLRNKYV